MAFERLFEDPIAALGYGLLTSRSNPLGTGINMLYEAQGEQRARENESYNKKLNEMKLALEMQKLQQPDLQFNPVTGEMVDMRTGMPFGGMPANSNGLTPALEKFAEQEKIRAGYQAEATSAAEQRRRDQEARAADAKLKDERAKAQVFGYDLAPDVIPTSQNVSGAQDLASAYGAYESSVNKVKSLIDKYGSAIGYGTDTAEVEQALNDLMQMERKLNETGVLNLGELPVLEKTYGTFNPMLKTNLLKSKEEMKQAADEYLSGRRGLINEKLRGYGYTRKQEKNAPPKKDAAARIAEIEKMLAEDE